MVEQLSPCPDENHLVMSVQGLLNPIDRDEIERHIDACQDCRTQLAQLLKTTVEADSSSGGGSEDGIDVLERGTNLGRYVLLDLVGRGGMAVVYSAYDPELDRKVAVKLLRTDRTSGLAPDVLRALLLREAQAMARLSHPNVIAVYDVGTFREQVFLAMEFVRGRSLRAWLTEAPRSWREILQMFLLAGEGLRAAHNAGLVHGDFKPDNVLVGPEDQMRVTDFGLSRSMRPSSSADLHPLQPTPSRATVTQGLAGTPSYLAPEQWRGRPADERTDQFSFCVALYEALYGSRPYPQTSSAFTGVPSDPSTFHTVPLWVRRVLHRGLSADPTLRFASMEGLLAALSRGLRAARYRKLLAAGSAVLLALGLAANAAVEVSARRKAELDLARAVNLVRLKWNEEQKLLDLRLEGGLKKDYLLEALGKADDIDISLGLAQETSEQGLVFAHDLIKSADLPMLKSEDVLLFVDATGRVVYNQADDAAYGKRPQGAEMLNRALAGEAVEALWSPSQSIRFPLALSAPVSGANLLLVFARPVTRGQKRLGAVLLGHWIKEPLLPRLEQTVGGRVVLRSTDGAQVATSEPLSASVESMADSPASQLLRLGSTRYLIQSGELFDLGSQPMGRAFLLRNYDRELDPIVSRFRRDAARFGLGTLVLALGAYLLWSLRLRLPQHGANA